MGVWHCALDMHTQRLVHKVENLSELAIPKKAMNQFWMPPLQPLQKKKRYMWGSPANPLTFLLLSQRPENPE